jgi:tetratricopeptide (TPR) repeat protein
MTKLLCTTLVLAAVCTALLPGAAATQTSEGIIDFGESAKEQIEYLEAMVQGNGDMPAERQSVILLWLAELYELAGDPDGVEYSYLRILAFFPYDVGVMNSYALFLLENRQQSERAESLLVAASQWGRYTDARSLNRGRTYELLAGVEMEKGDYEAALRHARLAIELMDEESSVGARRVLARTLRRSGALDEAAKAYIDLIAIERGAVSEDINELKLVIGETDDYGAEDLNDLLDGAIEAQNAARRHRVESEGAELVSVTSSGGVVLEGTLRRRDGPGAILFVPDLGATRAVYTPYAQLLGIDGVSSLSLDLRGQGGSRSDSLLTQVDLPLRHAQGLPADVVTGFRYLRDELRIETGRILIVAEGYACAVVEKAIRDGGLDAPAAYFSPVFTPDDLDLSNALAFHPDRPFLVFYTQEDLMALRSASYLKKIKDFHQLEVRSFKKSGHGVDMLRQNTDALTAFQKWTRETAGTN